MEAYCPSGRNRSPLLGPGPTPVHKWKASGGPTAPPSIGADGTLYVASYSGYAVALDPGDGGVRWKYTSPDDASQFWPLPVLAADNTLRFLDAVEGNYVVLGLDGAVRQSLFIAYDARGSLTIAADGTVYFADNTAHLVAMTGAGAIEWSAYGVSNDYNYPAVAHDGTVYSSNGTASVFALHPDGGTSWVSPSTEAPSRPTWSSRSTARCGWG